MKKIIFSITIMCLIIVTGFGNWSIVAAATPSLHLSLQGNESNTSITYPTEVNVTGWKTTDEGILSLLRYPALCHEGQGTGTTYYNRTGSIGVGKEGYDVFNPDLRHIKVVIGDINNDTINDIILISDTKEEWYLNTGTKAYLMPSKTLAWQNDIAGYGVVADINNDGKNEVVIAGADYYKGNVSVYAFKGEDGALLWRQDAEICPQPIFFSIPVNTIIAGDVNNDGNNEILIGTPNGLFILNGTDGSMMWNYTEYTNIYKTLLVDIDNDGVNEIITGARDVWNVFALSAVNQTKIWDNSEENAILLAPKVGYINPDEYKDLIIQHVGFGQDALVAYSLNNGTVLWVSSTLMGACSHSFRPPDLMDINGDGYNDVFATHDMVSFYFYDGRNGTILKEHDQIGHVHYLDFEEERKKIVAGTDEKSLRLALLNSTGDIVWNVDAGIGVYDYYSGDLGFLRPDIMGDYTFAFIASSSSHQLDQYLVLANLSDGYIFRKYSLPFLSWSRLPDIKKVDINGDGVEEIIIPTNTDVYIINKSILFDNEIYEPSQTLEPGAYNYTLNFYDPENGNSTSINRTFTVEKGDSAVDLLLNGTSGNTSISDGETVNITATCSNIEGTLYLYKDGVEIQNGTGVLSITNISSWSGSIGTIFNITAHYPETKNYNASSETWFIKIIDAGNLPTITNWHNNITNDNSTSITINESELIKFNVTADQPIDVWHWYKDGVDQLNNYDNFTTSWNINGTYKVNVSASNANGTSDPVTWTIAVNDSSPGSIVGNISYSCNETGIAGVTVNLTQNGTLINSTVTDGDGSYTFTDISPLPGDYNVMASKIRFWDNSTSVTINAGETTIANLMLWLKGDLNNEGHSADIGDLVLMKRARLGEIAGDWKYDLNNNTNIADIGDLVLMKRARLGEIELL